MPTEHDAILQTLDREVGGVYLPSAAFSRSVSAWDGIPLVYARDHPDMKLFDENPEAALAAVDGRIVGTLKDPRVETAGHPRLMGKLVFTDPSMHTCVNMGKLSLSTSFWARKNSDGIFESIRPQNVLVFRETEYDKPRDPGTWILNKQDTYRAGAGIITPDEIDAMLSEDVGDYAPVISKSEDTSRDWITPDEIDTMISGGHEQDTPITSKQTDRWHITIYDDGTVDITDIEIEE
jgi:hypothetical protein